MGTQLTFLSLIEIYKMPEGMQVTFKTSPLGVVEVDDLEQWEKAINEVIDEQKEVFMNYLSESKPVDEKYAELRERLTVQKIGTSLLGGELRFAITYDLADGPQIDSVLLRDYAAIQLMTFSYLSIEEFVGTHNKLRFAVALDPADDEPILGMERNYIFQAIAITENRLLTPEEITSQIERDMQQSCEM